MAILNQDNQGSADQIIGGLLSNPAFIAGLSVLGQDDESLKTLLPNLMQSQQQQALNQYRQQQAQQANLDYQLNQKKYLLAVRQQQQEEEKIKRFQDARTELEKLRGFAGQTPEQAGAIFNPDSQIYSGAGFEGGQIPAEQYRIKQAEIMTGLGDTRTAGSLYDDVTKPYNLSPGQVRFDAKGNPIGAGLDPAQNTLKLEQIKADYALLQKAQEASDSATKIKDLLKQARDITQKTSDRYLGPLADKSGYNSFSTNIQKLQQLRGLLTPLLRTMLEFPGSGFSEGDRELLIQGALNTAFDKDALISGIDTLSKLTDNITNKASSYREQLQNTGKINYQQSNNNKQDTPKRFRYNIETGRLE